MKPKQFDYEPEYATIAMKQDGFYVWDCSTIKVGNEYHMFSSHWPFKLGFGWNWLFHSEICHFVSSSPEGPFVFKNVVFSRRDKHYFDGMNTHNTCIKEYKGKFYLYYMGCTYPGPIPQNLIEIDEYFARETWNRKRIGVAVADDINGEFVRLDSPILEPRDCSHWDCTCTTNPSVIIKPDGTTYMIYKSRSMATSQLKLGIAIAPSPTGPFSRLCEGPILDMDMEDPFIWYDEKRNKFCLIAKDNELNNNGINKEYGSAFYAESDDCINFEVAEFPKVYSRTIRFKDGATKTLCNLERPSVLFDENGEPSYIYCASGDGDGPYCFVGPTYIVGIKLKRRK